MAKQTSDEHYEFPRLLQFFFYFFANVYMITVYVAQIIKKISSPDKLR